MKSQLAELERFKEESIKAEQDLKDKLKETETSLETANSKAEKLQKEIAEKSSEIDNLNQT